MSHGIYNKRWEQELLEQSDSLLNKKKIGHKIKKNILDEYQLEEVTRTICEAMKFNTALVISVYRDGFIEEITGHVHYIHEINQSLHVKDLKGDTLFIAFDAVLSLASTKQS
ncbi:YolD-like family protein [Bacillus velezensis]